VKRRRVLLLFADAEQNRTLSYQQGWPRNFRQSPRFHCVGLNVADRRITALLRGHAVSRLGRFDAVVLLHTVFSNACYLAGTLFDAVAAMRQPKAYFIGNEYKLMPEKMAFCDALGVKLLVTMNPHEQAQEMYRRRLGCLVVHIPSAALDPERFRPTTPRERRSIDVGYRAFDVPPYLGHNERREIAEYFVAHASDFGLSVDISLDPTERFDETGWAGFLNRCRAQLGTEAGGDFFELTDETRVRVTAFMESNPAATPADVRARFFDTYANPVPVRTISGRHVEAAGTKTVQLLFEGEYSGYFQPDVHYISVGKDFSDAGEAVRKLKDDGFCRLLADNACQVVNERLTYSRLIDQFANSLDTVL
jgi:hypothetical protein